MPKGYTLLYSFKGSPDGAVPYGGVILGGKGEIIGTTYSGGTANPPSSGAGTIFALSKSGSGYRESVVHDFAHDGYYPGTAPTLDPSGTLYATVQSGPSGETAGGIVALSPAQKGYNESGVFYFSAANGTSPGSQLLEIPDGSDGSDTSHVSNIANSNIANSNIANSNISNISNIANSNISNIGYGTLLYTTAFGGGASGCGSIASLTLALEYTDVYDFTCAHGDGAAPNGNLVLDMSRSFEGTTSAGGIGPEPGYGTVFKYDTITSSESVLYAFKGGSSDGSMPMGGVALDNQGNFYGTTQTGGASNAGTIFKLSYNGSVYKESILHSFGAAGDGATPLAAPVITVSSGILYGTTTAGGKNGAGALYKISTTGAGYKVLYSFTKSTGASPGYGSLMLDGNALYGTTEAGGASGQGTVYRFVP